VLKAYAMRVPFEGGSQRETPPRAREDAPAQKRTATRLANERYLQILKQEQSLTRQPN